MSGGQLADSLGGRLGALYPGDRGRQDRVEVAAAVEPESVSASASRRPHLTFLRSTDGLRLIGCGQGILSVHVLAPYPGWESFIEQAREAVNAMPESVRGTPVEMIAVRYIDRFALPSAGVAFNDFLTVMPAKPVGMPELLKGFHVALQTMDPKDGTIAILTVASAPSADDGHPAVIYDLNLQRQGTPICSMADNAWLSIVEDLHVRQRAIFEASITDKARELFQ
jgi:uncharacterized protein (TIGR04255 family)